MNEEVKKENKEISSETTLRDTIKEIQAKLDEENFEHYLEKHGITGKETTQEIIEKIKTIKETENITQVEADELLVKIDAIFDLKANDQKAEEEAAKMEAISSVTTDELNDALTAVTQNAVEETQEAPVTVQPELQNVAEEVQEKPVTEDIKIEAVSSTTEDGLKDAITASTQNAVEETQETLAEVQSEAQNEELQEAPVEETQEAPVTVQPELQNVAEEVQEKPVTEDIKIEAVSSTTEDGLKDAITASTQNAVEETQETPVVVQPEAQNEKKELMIVPETRMVVVSSTPDNGLNATLKAATQNAVEETQEAPVTEDIKIEAVSSTTDEGLKDVITSSTKNAVEETQETPVVVQPEAQNEKKELMIVPETRMVVVSSTQETRMQLYRKEPTQTKFKIAEKTAKKIKNNAEKEATKVNEGTINITINNYASEDDSSKTQDNQIGSNYKKHKEEILNKYITILHPDFKDFESFDKDKQTAYKTDYYFLMDNISNLEEMIKHSDSNLSEFDKLFNAMRDLIILNDRMKLSKFNESVTNESDKVIILDTEKYKLEMDTLHKDKMFIGDSYAIELLRSAEAVKLNETVRKQNEQFKDFGAKVR